MSTHLHLILDGEVLPTPALSMADGAARSLTEALAALGAELPTDAPPRRLDPEACASVLRAVARASFAEVDAAIAAAFPELRAESVSPFFDDVLKVVAAARSGDGLEVR